jgi:serine/threonine protein phosphatase 1
MAQLLWKGIEDSTNGWIIVTEQTVAGLQGLQQSEEQIDAWQLAWDKVSPEHVEFLSERCLKYYEDEHHIYVHANANAYFRLSDQSDDWLFWTRFEDAYPHISGKKMICGHTAQKGGLPNVKPFAICLDTWVYGQGWLTCLEVETGDLVQANQAGELRRITLKDLAEAPSNADTLQIKVPAAPGS